MPIHTGQDKNGNFYQWGKTGKKYYFKPGDEASRKRARGKAEAQQTAIYSSGWKGDSFMKLIKVTKKDSKNIMMKSKKIDFGGESFSFKSDGILWRPYGEGVKAKVNGNEYSGRFDEAFVRFTSYEDDNKKWDDFVFKHERELGYWQDVLWSPTYEKFEKGYQIAKKEGNMEIANYCKKYINQLKPIQNSFKKVLEYVKKKGYVIEV